MIEPVGTNQTDGGHDQSSLDGAKGSGTNLMGSELGTVLGGIEVDNAFSQNAAFNLEALSEQAFNMKC